MLLDASRSQLMIVDVQERLLPAMRAPDEVVRGCRILLESAHELGVPALVSEQYPKGLGSTAAELPVGSAKVVAKDDFSCARVPAIADTLRAGRERGRDQVVVAGIEAHVCLLQTCLELHDRGYAVAAVVDATSARADADLSAAKARLMAGGVALVTVEMVVFEWLGAAGTPAFKKLSALIR